MIKKYVDPQGDRKMVHERMMIIGLRDSSFFVQYGIFYRVPGDLHKDIKHWHDVLGRRC